MITTQLETDLALGGASGSDEQTASPDPGEHTLAAAAYRLTAVITGRPTIPGAIGIYFLASPIAGLTSAQIRSRGRKWTLDNFGNGAEQQRSTDVQASEGEYLHYAIDCGKIAETDVTLNLFVVEY